MSQDNLPPQLSPGSYDFCEHGIVDTIVELAN